MIENTNNNLEKKLNEFIGKNVTIIQEGFLKNQYQIHNNEKEIKLYLDNDTIICLYLKR